MKHSKKTKVLFLLPSLCAGGAERILITLMNNLDRERFEPEFVVVKNEGPFRDWIDDEIPFYSLDCSSIKSSVFKMLKLVKEVQPDVIFTTMVHSNALAILMKIFFPRVKVFVREAALPSSILNGYGLRGRACWFVYKGLYPLANKVISNCSQMIDEFKGLVKISTKNHEILFNPVDQARVKFKTRTPSNPSDPIRFLCVGRLSYEKGYDRLIEHMVVDFKPDFDWTLEIIGEGPFRADLEALIAKYDLSNKVILKGYDDKPWMSASYADCLLLPSRWEGMPNVVLEALCSAVPSIAIVDAGGVSDIGKYTRDGDLVITQDMNEFIQQMQKTKHNQNTHSLLPDAFSLPRVMKQFEDMLTA